MNFDDDSILILMCSNLLNRLIDFLMLKSETETLKSCLHQWFPLISCCCLRAQRLVNAQRTNCWRATSSWSFSCESSTAAGSCTRSIWSSLRKTAPPGLSSQSWRRSWETSTEPVPSSNSPSDSHDLTCPRFVITVLFFQSTTHRFNYFV